MVYLAQSRFPTRNALLILVAQGSFTSKSTQNLSNRTLFKSRYFILLPQPCDPVPLWFRSLTGNIRSPFSESQFCGSPNRLHIWTPTPLALEKCHPDSGQLDRAHINQSSHDSRTGWETGSLTPTQVSWDVGMEMTRAPSLSEEVPSLLCTTGRPGFSSG